MFNLVKDVICSHMGDIYWQGSAPKEQALQYSPANPGHFKDLHLKAGYSRLFRKALSYHRYCSTDKIIWGLYSYRSVASGNRNRTKKIPLSDNIIRYATDWRDILDGITFYIPFESKLADPEFDMEFELSHTINMSIDNAKKIGVLSHIDMIYYRDKNQITVRFTNV